MKSFRISLIAAALLASSALQAADVDLYGRIDTGYFSIRSTTANLRTPSP